MTRTPAHPLRLGTRQTAAALTLAMTALAVLSAFGWTAATPNGRAVVAAESPTVDSQPRRAVVSKPRLAGRPDGRHRASILVVPNERTNEKSAGAPLLASILSRNRDGRG